MSDPSSDLSDLQTAILTFDPAAVRVALNHYDPGTKEKPWHYENGSTPLHTITSSGEIHIPPCTSTSISTHTPPTLDEWGGASGVEWEAAPTPPAPPWSAGCGGERWYRRRMCIVYMLCDVGVEVNAVDGCGSTPLHHAARRGDAALCDALLQCGADLEAQQNGRPLWVEVAAAAQREVLRNKEKQTDKEEERKEDRNKKDNYKKGNNNKTNQIREEEEKRKKFNNRKEREEIYDYYNREEEQEEVTDISARPGHPRCPAQAVWQLFRFYWPGLWRAVANEDVDKVRQLVNAWCKVDLSCGGVTLLEAAQSTANETITSLLQAIQPSLALVHSCLADNLPAIRALLASPARRRLNLDIRRLSERAAPLLYFVVRGGQHHAAAELCRYGASCLTHMLPEDDVTGRCTPESAVVFEALESWLPAAVLASILPAPGTCMAQALARACGSGGGSVLRVAVERGVLPQAVEALVCVGGPSLLYECNPAGHTPHDTALRLNRTHLARLLDHHVTAWLAQPSLYHGHRTALALAGYGRLRMLGGEAVGLAEGGEEEVLAFLEEYSRCQVFLGRVFGAIGEGVEEDVLVRMVSDYHSNTFHLQDVLWRGRMQGDGMPLFHWAVLHSHLGALHLLLKPPHSTHTPTHPPLTTRFCLDEVRDPWRRTPLHYALAIQGGAALADALLDAGCSEHTLDMYGREPLDFRDVRGSPAIDNLLENLRNKVYVSPPNPDPWDPEVLRSHLEHLRRERFHHHHHHHHHHNHHHRTSKFPTAPTSDFLWPLPKEEEEEKEDGWRVCKTM